MPQREVAASHCVGRDAELAQLAELYRDVRQGERLALVEGPSGAGKSRLLQTFRSRLRLEGGVVLEGRCEPGRAFGPFAQIVDSALRFLDEVGVAPSIQLGDLACREACHRFWYQHDGGEETGGLEVTSDATNEALDALEKRLRFFDAIDGLLRDVASVRPPVVMLHDLERADRGTLQLLQFVLDGSGPWGDGVAPERTLQALVVASLRSDAATVDDSTLDALRRHDSSVVLSVSTLDEAGVRAYLQSPDAVARVLQRTGGLPENIDLLLEADPLTPEAHLERQLRSVGSTARALVEALAVLEHPSDLELLADVAGVTPSKAERTEFDGSELVARSVVDGRILFAFARESSRERAYALLDEERRRALHARCAELLEPRPAQAREAAHHALRSGDLQRAVPLAIDAARSLAARHAHAEAATVLETVLDHTPDEEVATQVGEYLADLYRVAGDYRGALAHAERVRARHPDCPVAARRVGDLLTLAGQLDEAAATLEDAHRLASGAQDPAIKVEVEALLAELHYQRASYDEAHGWAEQALTAAEQLGALSLELHARNTLGKLAIAQKDASTAVESFEQNRAKACASGLGHQEAQALTNLGVALLRRQDLGAAQDAFARAIEVASEASDTRDRAIATENLAVLAHLRRDYGEALRHYHEAVAMLKRLGNRAMLARVANNLGELYLSLGETRRARALCEFAAHMGGTGLPPSVAGEGLLLRGRVEAADGHTSSARASFEAALSTFERLGEARVGVAAAELARIALAEGDVGRARELANGLPEPESPKRAAEVALVWADLERAAGAETLRVARRAAEQADEAGDDELLLPALVRLARAYIDDGDLSRAHRALERAQEIEQRLTTRVPEEAAEAWSQRPARTELTTVEAQLAAAWRAGPRASEPPRSRISSLPPAPRSQGVDEMQQQRWRERYPRIVGSSRPIQNVLTLLDKVAPTDALVLVRGESGTGKELVAEALHRGSPRRDKPLVKVNCAALVETLLLSELFGHERGAFTGASQRKRGRFEIADGGTIFLDEIGDISPKTQMALLRVLQEREFERVGGTQAIKVDVRIIAATHRDLEKMVRDGEFREDLYYRLRGVMIETPPLRQRGEDLGELCDHLLGRIAEDRGEPAKVMSPEALDLLSGHTWPGNVRELENVLRSATLFAEGEVLGAEDFSAFAETFQAADPEPETSVHAEGAAPPPAGSLEDRIYDRVRGGDHSLLDLKKEIERECIVRALTDTDGNITRAATLLGMKRPRLSQLVKQYGLQAVAQAQESKS